MPDSGPPPRPKTVLELILEWSLDRPAWQRDALRRIVQTDKRTDGDIAELVALCKRGRVQNPPVDGLAPIPLEAAHLPANPGAGAAVALTAIKDVAAVNNLAPGQTLTFPLNGIVVVYGDNAAGKSGYARILKRACRARHSEAILSNVYGERTAAPATATFCYSIGGSQQPPEVWTDIGEAQPQPHPILSAISVFDASCAAVHLRTRNEVAFRPFGLDVPDELADACKRVKAVLDAEKQPLEAGRNAIFANPPWKPTTAAGKAVNALTYATNAATLETLATLTEQDADRLARLKEDLSKNPATAATEQRLKAERIKKLADILATIAAGTGDAAFDQLFALHADAATKRATARLAAEKLFAGDCLPEVGGEVWRNLWEAARRYSTEIVLPEAPFPPVDPGTLCVLCQQPLTPEAVARMQRFEAFIRDDTERQAQAAEATFQTAERGLSDLTISLEPIADALREIELQNRDLSRTIRRAVAGARLRRYALQRRLRGDRQATIPAPAPFPTDRIAALQAATRQYAADLQSAAASADRKALEAEYQELADREALRTHLTAVKAEIAWLQSLRFLDTCLSDTTTNTITTLGNRIADQVLTPRLRDKFAQEIINLAGNRVRVEMVRASGQYGSPHYQVRLLAAPNVNVAGVLSEGEQTCVAIAAFLAELATASHASALMFDDPITSLDHKWRDRVAKRLVEEASVCQVVVFTHDLIFLNDIEEAAEHSGVPCETRYVRQTAAGAGIVNADLPWDGMKLPARVQKLQESAQSLARTRPQADEETYERDARHFYDDLRAAWERALEEVAFAQVVMRHRDQIKPAPLLKVTVLTEQDCQVWSANYANCCGQMAGHDQSRGRNRAVPEPDGLLADAQALATWMGSIRDRQKPFN